MKMRILSTCLIVFITSSAFATDIRINGFASIVAGQTLDSEDTLYGYENDLNFKNDSLAAIQFGANLKDGLSATVQLVARGSKNYEVDAEWVYLTYEFNDSVQLSAGRIRMPFYRYSDYLDVRYTYPWVKVPQTVYGFELPGYDGLSLLINSSMGDWDSSVQLVHGAMAETDFGGAIVSVDQMLGANWTMVRDWLTLRATYLTMDISNANAGYTGLAQLATSLGTDTADTSELVDFILVEDDSAYFSGLFASIDYNDWLLDFEYIQYGSDTLSATVDAYFLNAGKRIGKFTPFVTYSQQETADPDGEFLKYIPSSLSDTSTAIITNAINGFTAITASDTDLSLVGVRYDFHDSAALKIEYAQQEDISGESNAIVRVGLDLIF